MTTHNPLVLDGLDLRNGGIRLFAVDRDKNGYTQIKRSDEWKTWRGAGVDMMNIGMDEMEQVTELCLSAKMFEKEIISMKPN